MLHRPLDRPRPERSRRPLQEATYGDFAYAHGLIDRVQRDRVAELYAACAAAIERSQPVTAAGNRAYMLNYRIDGRERRYTIGSATEWSAGAARRVG